MAQVAPPTQLALQSIQVNENLSKYPQTHYGIPKSDNDFAAARDSLRDRARSINTNNYVSQNEKITLIIPPQQRNLVPDETLIRLEVGVSGDYNLSPYSINGSIQRAIERITIRDGRGTVLETINNYNVIAETLMQAHIPERAQKNILQAEGVYPSETTYALSGEDNRKVITFRSAVSQANIKPTSDDPDVGTTEEFQNVALTPTLFPEHNRTFNGTYTKLTDQSNVSANDNNNRPYSEICKVGDTILINVVTGIAPVITETFYVYVVEVVDDGVILSENILSKLVRNAAAGAVGRLNWLQICPRNTFSDYYRNISQRWRKNQTATFTFNPIASGILTSSKHIPLWVTKGLQIELTLAGNNTIFNTKNTTFTNPPQIKVTDADVFYTAVTLTPVMQSALESQYHRRGLNLLVPVFHCDLRNVGTTTIIQEDYYNSFAMLNRTYQFCRSQAAIDRITSDSFRHVLTAPTRRYIEYNRIYMPHWGNDTDTNAIDHWNESRKGINLLGDKKFELISYGQHVSDGYIENVNNSVGAVDENGVPYNTEGVSLRSASKCKELFINNLETEPSGFLTGVDTNNGTIRLRLETSKAANKQLVMIFMAFKMITFQDGAPPLVQE